MPVLYGVFLYMGISSLDGIQFMHRIILILMPEKHQPDFIFLRHVKTLKVHLFTIIQASSLALLWIIKSNKTISILFPVMVLALVGIRKLLDYIFTQKELSYLDDIMPEIMKRSKEDGKEENGADESTHHNNDNEKHSNKNNESVNISQEIAKTHIWKDLVSSDKHLASNNGNKKKFEPQPKRGGSFSMASLKLRKPSKVDASGNNESGSKSADVNIPLLSTQTSKSNTDQNNMIPTIVIDNNYNTRSIAQSPVESNYYKDRKDFFLNKDDQTKL